MLVLFCIVIIVSRPTTNSFSFSVIFWTLNLHTDLFNANVVDYLYYLFNSISFSVIPVFEFHIPFEMQPPFCSHYLVD